jgi:hypothetical protein
LPATRTTTYATRAGPSCAAFAYHCWPYRFARTLSVHRHVFPCCTDCLLRSRTTAGHTGSPVPFQFTAMCSHVAQTGYCVRVPLLAWPMCAGGVCHAFYTRALTYVLASGCHIEHRCPARRRYSCRKTAVHMALRAVPSAARRSVVPAHWRVLWLRARGCVLTHCAHTRYTQALDDPFMRADTLPTQESVGDAPVKLAYYPQGGQCCCQNPHNRRHTDSVTHRSTHTTHHTNSHRKRHGVIICLLQPLIFSHACVHCQIFL